MNKNTITAAAAALAIAALPAASQAYNCAAITGTPTADGQGASLYSSGYYGQNLTNSFSVGLWAKNLTAVWHLYVFSTQRVNLYCPNTGGRANLNFSVVQEDAVSGTNATITATLADARTAILNDGSWHFYCCTFRYDAADPSASFQRLYIDGTLRAEVSGAAILGPAATPDSSRKFTIGGQWATDGGNYTNWKPRSGAVSEVTTWSRALSAAEVAALATHRAGGFESGLAVYWPLTGTSLDDGGNWARGGVSASMSQNTNVMKFVMDDDDTLPLGNFRCVASPSWVAEHGYAAPPNATFRSWDDPATNIQQAIDVAYKYETVYVMDGTYPVSETIAVTNANTVLRSWNRDTGLVDAEGTVLDAQGLCRTLSVGASGKADLAIEVSGFTIANARSAASGGGAVLYGNASSPASAGKRCMVADCVFTNCVTDAGGGGILAKGGIVSNCSFQACTAATYGGGVGIPDGAVNVSTYNARTIPHTAPWIVGCDFTGCRAGLRGGAIGIAVDYYWASAVIEDSRFIDCTTTNGTSSCYGGHVFSGYGTCLSDCTFSGKAEAKYGACVAIANATVSNCVFESVAAQTDCHGLAHSKGRSKDSPPTRYIDCVVTNCSASRGFFSENSSDSVLMRDCLVAGNAFAYAFVAHGSTNGIIENCTFASNGASAYDLYHGGSSAKAVAVNSIFDSPKAADGNTATFRTVLSNCVVRVRSAPDAEDSAVRVAPPQFADAANRDYRLAATSKCREKGLLLDWMAPGATDLAGAPRLADLYGRAFTADALPDLGCYECQERGILPTMLTVR